MRRFAGIGFIRTIPNPTELFRTIPNHKVPHTSTFLDSNGLKPILSGIYSYLQSSTPIYT